MTTFLVQKVQIVIGQVQATENIITRLEDKIRTQLAEPATTSEELEMKLRILKAASRSLVVINAYPMTLYM